MGSVYLDSAMHEVVKRERREQYEGANDGEQRRVPARDVLLEMMKPEYQAMIRQKRGEDVTE